MNCDENSFTLRSTCIQIHPKFVALQDRNVDLYKTKMNHLKSLKIERNISSKRNYNLMAVLVFCLLGYDDMDSIYATAEDFKNMKERERIRGVHLLEYFIKRCNEIGVIVFLFYVYMLYPFLLFSCGFHYLLSDQVQKFLFCLPSDL